MANIGFIFLLIQLFIVETAAPGIVTIRVFLPSMLAFVVTDPGRDVVVVVRVIRVVRERVELVRDCFGLITACITLALRRLLLLLVVLMLRRRLLLRLFTLLRDALI